ncbi:MAG TPA: M1 family aminopeptidase [Phycisphaerae bacterium]|nr:M1 family aminopeptidase [Phycisphaerae bacterium]
MRASTFVFGLTGLLWSASAHAQGYTVNDEQCGVQVALPAADWVLTDESQSPAIVHIYSPAKPPVPRLTLLRLPKVLWPQGMRTRAQQIEMMLKTKPSITHGKIGKQKADRLEYVVEGVRTIEYGVVRGDAIVMIQIAATEEVWKDAAQNKSFERVFDSIIFVAGAASKPVTTRPAPPRTPEQVREARRAAEPSPQKFVIRKHDIVVEIDPRKQRLASHDTFEIESVVDGLREIQLSCSDLTVDSLRSGEQELTWKRSSADSIEVALPNPLNRGQKFTVECRLHDDDYDFSIDQELVAEVAVLGQVRADSSYSSHVSYYPIDALNSAEVQLTFRVPEGYVAVSGGDFRGESVESGIATFRYEAPRGRSRLLPFGFAVDRYLTLRATTSGGLGLEFHYRAGDEKKARQRLELAVRAAELFERQMGTLPWNRVAFCHVRPVRMETGVSLPGLILISDAFFGDLQGVQPRGANLDDPGTLGATLITDELAHQWNAYAAPLPNELAEGVSTYTNLLFLEHVYGASEYRAGVAYCARAYCAGAEILGDEALAHPALYECKCYRTVAFTKVPVVLHMLRQRLGDEAFFRGWRRVFQAVDDRDKGYDQFQAAFEAASKQQLDAFFDDWFFRAGYPKLEADWKQGGDSTSQAIQLRQTQDGPPYQVEIEIEIAFQSGEITRRAVSMLKKTHTLSVDGPSPISRVGIDPDDVALVHSADGNK